MGTSMGSSSFEDLMAGEDEGAQEEQTPPERSEASATSTPPVTDESESGAENDEEEEGNTDNVGDGDQETSAPSSKVAEQQSKEDPDNAARVQYELDHALAVALLSAKLDEYANNPSTKRANVIDALKAHMDKPYLTAPEKSEAAEIVNQLETRQERTLFCMAVGEPLVDALVHQRLNHADEGELREAANTLTNMLRQSKKIFVKTETEVKGRLAAITEEQERRAAATAAKYDADSFTEAGAAAAAGKSVAQPATEPANATPAPSTETASSYAPPPPPPPPKNTGTAGTGADTDPTKPAVTKTAKAEWKHNAKNLLLILAFPLGVGLVIALAVHFARRDEGPTDADTTVSAGTAVADANATPAVAPPPAPPPAPVPVPAVEPPVQPAATPPPAPPQGGGGTNPPECVAAVNAPLACDHANPAAAVARNATWNCAGATVVQYQDGTYNVCACRWCEAPAQ